jgi:uncharacterized protein YjbI with pentapeptide repeats
MTSKKFLVEKLLSGTEIWNQWRTENPSQGRLDFTQVNLSGANLSGANLSEADLTGADLSGADLRQAKLYASFIGGANLRSANLRGAKLNGAILTTADLSFADLWSATFHSSTYLVNSALSQLYPSEYNPIIMAMWRHQLVKTNLIEANLQNANLQAAQLQQAILSNANLADANLLGADLYCADLSGANLSGADLRHAYLDYINLRNTIISRKTKINDRWRRISFLLSDKVTKPYHWSGAELKYADLEGVDLSGAQMPYADLRGANLRNANLMGANFDYARMWDAILEGAKYNRDTVLSQLTRIQFRSLILVNPPPQPDNKEVLVDLENLKDSRKRTNVFRVSRKDQQKFREMLIDAFQGKCAITQCDVEGAMEAAHIFPYRGEETDCLWNGILLRLDLHRLFDSYLLTIDPHTGQVHLSPSLMNSYGKYAFTQVSFPEQPISLNRQQVLEWHQAQCTWLSSSTDL